MKHHFEAIDFSDLDFEAIHKEMIANEDTKGAMVDEQAGVDAQAIHLDDPLLTLPLVFFMFALFWFALIFWAGSRLCFDDFILDNLFSYLYFANDLEHLIFTCFLLT